MSFLYLILGGWNNFMFKFREFLTELSQSRRLSQQIVGKDEEILRHALKLLLTDNESRNHYKQEMWAFVSSFAFKTLKGSNKKPFYNFYFTNLWGATLGHNTLQNLQLTIKAIFDEEVPTSILNVIALELNSFYDELCKIISSKNITREELYSLCDTYLDSHYLCNWGRTSYIKSFMSDTQAQII